MINVVLIEPEIPQNTGNIVRTIAATGCKLHLIKPLGFSLDEKSVRRAGLDYWPQADITVYENIDEFFATHSGNFYFATTKGRHLHTEPNYPDNCYVFFGKESAGIDEKILAANYDKCIRIPMINDTRSLNLSNSVAIIVYEALRHQGFIGFNTQGKLRTVDIEDINLEN